MRIRFQLLDRSDDYVNNSGLLPDPTNGPFMFLGTTYLRRITCCLAILLSPMGSLQQSHAFCHWTDCASAGDQVDTCIACCTAKDCCHDSSDHEHGPAIERTGPQAYGAHQDNLPCHNGCWCCRSVDPVTTASDATDGAKRLLTSISLISVDSLVGAWAEHVVSPFDENALRDADTLSAAQLCVQLCRFRI